MSRYQLIKQVAAAEPVQVLCHVLAVSVAGYYQWRSRPARPTSAWEPAATAAFCAMPRAMARAELRARGHVVGRYALRQALAESGWSTLKTELLPRGACFADLQEAQLELAEYLDHYNTQRLHSALGYCNPLEIELHYLFSLP